MAGTRLGGKRAAETNIRREPDFYKRIGSIGGKLSGNGGFAHALLCDCNYEEDPHKKARCAGAKGGLISKRKKLVK